MKSQPEPAMRCGVCGSTGARELYTAKDRLRNSEDTFAIAECEGCGVLRTLPEMDEGELAKFYPDDYWGGAEPTREWIQSSQAEKTRFVAGCKLTGGSILDVGCGAGFFLRALDAAKWDRFGVETGAGASKAAGQALGSGKVFTGTLVGSQWPDSKFDVVSFWSSLEHTNEPRANLIEARRILKTNGTVIIQLPNAASYQARMFGGDWFALDAPRHRYHFTLEVLGRLLSETGFQIYSVTYLSKAHNAHALRQSLKSRLAGESSNAFGRALFYLSIPIIKPCDLLMSATGNGATLTLAARAV